MDEIQVVETDSWTPKTGTVADPQQTTSVPQAESMEMADKLKPKGSAEVDDAFIDNFQNLHISGPVRIKKQDFIASHSSNATLQLSEKRRYS
ncbi:hypothetical protein Y1Q_0018860 [Alligator mississippiensis]|uniref:Uncharacterized protein n=1 Tax=Alligator mississippiensis TaxID=8496 RepID=A0A151M2X4_ALLMI|nr:hypothetical protein Y1Q_0018860 [Alligator mississippiensis]